MTNAEIIAAVVLSLFASGGAGWSLVADYLKTRARAAKVPKLEEDCAKCRENMESRLDDGEGEFNKTHFDIMKTAKDAALRNAQMRADFLRQFVTEATFKERVFAIIMEKCPVCGNRGRGGNET